MQPSGTCAAGQEPGPRQKAGLVLVLLELVLVLELLELELLVLVVLRVL